MSNLESGHSPTETGGQLFKSDSRPAGMLKKTLKAGIKAGALAAALIGGEGAMVAQQNISPIQEKEAAVADAGERKASYFIVYDNVANTVMYNTRVRIRGKGLHLSRVGGKLGKDIDLMQNGSVAGVEILAEREAGKLSNNLIVKIHKKLQIEGEKEQVVIMRIIKGVSIEYLPSENIPTNHAKK